MSVNTLLYYMTIPLLLRGFYYERIQTVATSTNGVKYGVPEVLKIHSLVRDTFNGMVNYFFHSNRFNFKG